MVAPHALWAALVAAGVGAAVGRAASVAPVAAFFAVATVLWAGGVLVVAGWGAVVVVGGCGGAGTGELLGLGAGLGWMLVALCSKCCVQGEGTSKAWNEKE